jgi:hypothetical protein
LDEAPLGSVDRRSANREAACAHVVADPRVGRQSDLFWLLLGLLNRSSGSFSISGVSSFR